MVENYQTDYVWWNTTRLIMYFGDVNVKKCKRMITQPPIPNGASFAE